MLRTIRFYNFKFLWLHWCSTSVGDLTHITPDYRYTEESKVFWVLMKFDHKVYQVNMLSMQYKRHLYCSSLNNVDMYSKNPV